ncbi:hypothetical protein [Microbulbifer sp. TYP-18]|uniref:hypothetical protein n=1 Tax=Microbulbifer sp. TYP-18 TaxID=3230024 RepID=UPI0034C5ED8A
MKFFVFLLSVLMASNSLAKTACKELVTEISTENISSQSKLARLNEEKSCSGVPEYEYEKAILLASTRDLNGAPSILESRKI